MSNSRAGRFWLRGFTSLAILSLLLTGCSRQAGEPESREKPATPHPGKHRLVQDGDIWTYETQGTEKSTVSSAAESFNGPLVISILNQQDPRGRDGLLQLWTWKTSKGKVLGTSESWLRQAEDGDVYLRGERNGDGPLGWVTHPSGEIKIDEFPLKVGDKFSYRYDLDTKQWNEGSQVVEGLERVQTAAGEFDTFRIRGQWSDPEGSYSCVRWFDPGVGAVKFEQKEVYRDSTVDFTGELNSYSFK
ncbi:MAG: hypothetical protein HY319_04290 [Armatimonadetes bacterium]|nr:hypothetical protein [Armatimonadota bacterium]